MLNTSARLLRLLTLLQIPRDWTGAQLGERLSVSSRTIRADVERLRSLGYPVEATSGVAGGYRLGAGAALPPLLLDDDEALAVAVGLRTAVGGFTGIEESSVRALAKLEQVLPPRLRQQLTTLLTATAAISPPAGAEVDPEVLTAIASAVRFREQVRFDYAAFDGTESRRAAEPHRLIFTSGRWYLAGWDTGAADWRTFRVDRMRLRVPNGPRFPARDEPGGDLVAFVERSIGAATWACRARAVVSAPAAQLAPRLPPAVLVEELDPDHCAVHVGSDTPEQLAMWLGLLGADFTVDGPPELVLELRRMSRRYARAASGSSRQRADR